MWFTCSRSFELYQDIGVAIKEISLVVSTELLQYDFFNRLVLKLTYMY